jgi:hypothetical protein
MLCSKSHHNTARKTYVLHEFFAGNTNILSKSGTEHHNLLVSRSRPEDLLYVSSHV